MKNLLLVLSLLFCVTEAIAQQGLRLGVAGGVQIANRRHGIPELPTTPNFYQQKLNKGYDHSKTSARAGLVAALPLKGNWTLESGLLFNTKGFRELNVLSTEFLNNNQMVRFYADYHTTLYYVDLPLKVAYRFGPAEGASGFQVSAGSYLSWLVSATQHIKPPNPSAGSGAPQLPEQRHQLSIGYQQGTRDANGQFSRRDDYRPLDFGLEAGLAYEFSSGLFVKAEGQLGLANIVTGHLVYDPLLYPLLLKGFSRNRSASLSAGYFFSGKKR